MIYQKIYIGLIITSFWVSSDTNIEVIAICVPNVTDKIFGVVKTTLGGYPLFLLSGGVTT